MATRLPRSVGEGEAAGPSSVLGVSSMSVTESGAGKLAHTSPKSAIESGPEGAYSEGASSGETTSTG
eukprot:8807987-Heterocapsa_arctica.AAC.1